MNEEMSLDDAMRANEHGQNLDMLKMIILFTRNLNRDDLRRSFMETLHSGKLDDFQKMACVCNLKILNNLDQVDRLIQSLHEKVESLEENDAAN